MNAPEPLFNDPELTRLYDLMTSKDDAQEMRADFAFCKNMAKGCGSVLDIGCGTGELATMLAPDRRVTGLDPSAAMLEIANYRPGGDTVTWVQGDACAFNLGEKYELILLTGHAWQCLLSDEQQISALKSIARHLTPNGRLLFDSRNPGFRIWDSWTEKDTGGECSDPNIGTVQYQSDYAYDDDDDSGILTYSYTFTFPDGRHKKATSRIRFTPLHQRQSHMSHTGLHPYCVFGDWHGAEWRPHAPEIIPYAGLTP